jgi:hypothetical protein
MNLVIYSDAVMIISVCDDDALFGKLEMEGSTHYHHRISD